MSPKALGLFFDPLNESFIFFLYTLSEKNQKITMGVYYENRLYCFSFSR